MEHITLLKLTSRAVSSRMIYKSLKSSFNIFQDKFMKRRTLRIFLMIYRPLEGLGWAFLSFFDSFHFTISNLYDCKDERARRTFITSWSQVLSRSNNFYFFYHHIYTCTDKSKHIF